MSLATRRRRLERHRISDRLQARAQELVRSTITCERSNWIASGVERGRREAREALTRVLVPPQDERNPYAVQEIQKRPGHRSLFVPVYAPVVWRAGRIDADTRHGADVVEFEYRPMSLTVHETTLRWWDLVPRRPIDETQTVDRLLELTSALRHEARLLANYAHMPGAERGINIIADRIDTMVPALRLAHRERVRARIKAAPKTKSVTPAACISPNRGHDAGREE